MFIVIEGIDGSGKSTISSIVKNYLEKNGKSVYLTMEPTGNEIGKLIRKRLSNKEANSDNFFRELALLFAADRVDHVENEIRPMQKDGKVVLCDRYLFSSLAYQTLNVDYDWVKNINRFAVMPDFLIYVDVPVEIAFERIHSRNETIEVFETKSKMEKIKENYDKILIDYEKALKIIKIDGTVPLESLEEEVSKKIEGKIFC